MSRLKGWSLLPCLTSDFPLQATPDGNGGAEGIAADTTKDAAKGRKKRNEVAAEAAAAAALCKANKPNRLPNLNAHRQAYM